MAATLLLGPVRDDGLAPIFLRVQDFKSGLQIKQKTGLLIAPSVWEKRSDEKALDKFMKIPDLARTLNACTEIRRAINAQFEAGHLMSKDEVREMTQAIVYREEKQAEEEAAAAKAAEEAEAKRMTLRKFIDQFRADIAAGRRMTDKGTLYAPGTINAINQACERLKKFEKHKKHVYDFDEIDMAFYKDYTAYLNAQGYAINTTGKCIKQLKAIMALAESEGYHSNGKYKDKRFKGTRVEVDSIYLTKEDLEAIRKVDLRNRGYGFDLARDIFFVGVWTAQRVSDYNNIHREDIETYTKRSIVDVPDPENPGKTKPIVQEKEITVINIKQKKTGARVAIPCSSELKAILEKYDFNIPHLSDQNINDNIKEIARLAGLTDKVRMTTTKGGRVGEEWVEKYKLVHSHTARRTGATLMYLAGMDIYDIMKITGHSTPVMLKKYIKADELEVVDKITDKYNYFD